MHWSESESQNMSKYLKSTHHMLGIILLQSSLVSIFFSVYYDAFPLLVLRGKLSTVCSLQDPGHPDVKCHKNL